MFLEYHSKISTMLWIIISNLVNIILQVVVLHYACISQSLSLSCDFVENLCVSLSLSLLFLPLQSSTTKILCLQDFK